MTDEVSSENECTEYPPISYQEAKTMSVDQLRQEMNKRGLNAIGAKKKLLNRIRFYSGHGLYFFFFICLFV